MKKFLRFILLFFAFLVLFSSFGSSDKTGTKQNATTKSDASTTNTDALNDIKTRNTICDFFERNGLKIMRFLSMPVIEKDPGLYGGQERWTITLEDGEQITAFVTDGTITFCYGGVEYDYLPLY